MRWLLRGSRKGGHRARPRIRRGSARTSCGGYLPLPESRGCSGRPAQLVERPLEVGGVPGLVCGGVAPVRHRPVWPALAPRSGPSAAASTPRRVTGLLEKRERTARQRVAGASGRAAGGRGRVERFGGAAPAGRARPDVSRAGLPAGHESLGQRGAGRTGLAGGGTSGAVRRGKPTVGRGRAGTAHRSGRARRRSKAPQCGGAGAAGFCRVHHQGEN